ncbi:hypothetical protein [Sporolactobacillus nakayamae]|uniref:mRNA interferase RelE/StbE n=1 Tax=Sporolactobacillus nakayamae TaxID=269670 RepID=A0A1I2W8H5_9BACL|nr:hypothetical protein [Sporolactobacillus nakayamae]SFG96927.1 mRNA interferase RelE/StbE [Sporolactobacillus nakayamae]
MAKFKIEFISRAAAIEFSKLDRSSRLFVEKAFRKLEFRADKIGKPLSNTPFGLLRGCKEIKFRRLGIRIIFRIINGQAQIVQIVTINQRENDKVFRIASERLNKNPE